MGPLGDALVFPRWLDPCKKSGPKFQTLSWWEVLGGLGSAQGRKGRSGVRSG
jgi:hypothetical protein